MMQVDAIPAFNDNYIWCVQADDQALIVDPGDAQPVRAALAERGLSLAAILVTHHHYDHTGGIVELKQQTRCRVYGPDNPDIEGVDQVVTGGEVIPLLGLDFQVLNVPGHTLDHIAWFQDGRRGHGSGAPWLFCGDTLFAAGCGRLFEGDAATMQHSLETLRQLPADTEIYCAHEYTLANLKFAAAVEPDNSAVRQRLAAVRARREAGEITLPSTLGVELETNPFLRWDQPAVQAAARTRQPGASTEEAGVFAAIRQWKDVFKA